MTPDVEITRLHHEHDLQSAVLSLYFADLLDVGFIFYPGGRLLFCDVFMNRLERQRRSAFRPDSDRSN
jgi:hypothetical protein